MLDKVSSDLYEEYVVELSEHLFGHSNIRKFIESRGKGHRGERTLDLLLLKNEQTYWYFYNRRKKYNLEANYRGINNALYTRQRISPLTMGLCKEFIEKYRIPNPVFVGSLSRSRQLLKGLDSYVAFRLKKEFAASIETV